MYKWNVIPVENIFEIELPIVPARECCIRDTAVEMLGNHFQTGAQLLRELIFYGEWFFGNIDKNEISDSLNSKLLQVQFRTITDIVNVLIRNTSQSSVAMKAPAVIRAQ